MTQNLPPIDDSDDLGETSPIDHQRTRPNAPITGRYPAQPPPPTTGHVRPTTIHPPQAPPPSGYVQPVPPRRKARDRRDSGLYLPLWSLILMLLGVLVAAFAVVFIVVSLGGGIAVSSTPIFRIITAIPSDTPAFEQSVLATATLPPQAQQLVQTPPNIALDGPTLPAVEFTATPEALAIGKRIVVFDVGETQLNVRDKPGITDSNVLFRAADGDIFVIFAGPESANGFTWWRIQDPNDPTRLGWAAEAYLRVIP